MIATLLTFRCGSHFDEPRLRQIADSAKGKFLGMPGLRSKAFTVDAESREAKNFYVWETEEAARSFFTQDALRRIGALYGAEPSVQYLQVAVLVDNGPSR